MVNTIKAGVQARVPFRAAGPARPVPACPPAIQNAATRRELLQLGIALPLLGAGPALADSAAPVASAPAPMAITEAPYGVDEVPAAPEMAEVYLDVDFQIVPPRGWAFVDTQPPYDPERRGPAPEPSPIRARFDSPDGSAVVSVLVRPASAIKQMVLQVTDVTQLGTLEEAAKLLLPKGSRVVKGSVLQVNRPPKETPAGPVELPPKTYYRYEFTLNGLHVAMNISAQRGRVYVAGCSVADGALWAKYGPALRASAESFRLRAEKMTL
ncbi:hypothetical protein HYH03_003677 [Edaphochlamys debaryana]|uniref:PsbP C-terminal domain-containing protein n=1 Tax=Edaphochlamys debaryana TaxID=47281 RepID=A0A835YB19_9CHLO|nr:hypothetical protein HYH03_003677 [Edaphochlamys debaryana]|eukprot:KAG2498419.1 hypothetical protein HYH03_003677 [Edaphochlamys debaryana]